MTLDRRGFVRKTGLGAAGLSMAGSALSGLSLSQLTGCDSRPGRRPNIIYIMADDLGYGDLGCYGQEKVRTPHIDRLAAEGMRFTDHYAGSTVCAPSRCSLMTGYHTGHTFIRGNREIQPEGQQPIPADSVTVARLLQKAGYVTGATGKWGLGPPGSEGDPVQQGFDYFYGYNCQREAHFYYPEHLWENEQKVVLDANLDGAKEIFSHDLIAEKTLDFIRRNSDQPFFLYVPFTIPHAEIVVPDDSLAEYEGAFPETPYIGSHYGSHETPRAAFAGMVTRMDRDVGRIRALLEALGISEETLILFTSDNGSHLEGGHDPRFFGSSGPLRGFKRDLYEGGIRVPMVAWWPGTIAAGTLSDHPSAFWDFLPTACDIAGIDPPTDGDGISYLPELLGGREQPEHAYLYWEFHEQGRKQAVRMGRWKGVRLHVRSDPDGPIELYDLTVDIAEEHDVSGAHPEIVTRMRLIMAEAHEPSELFPLTDQEG
ncbi:arylsulfatase [Candidatus Zixiibacteriota bacterium]